MGYSVEEFPDEWVEVKEATRIEPFSLGSLALVPQTLDGNILVMDMGDFVTYGNLTHQDIQDLLVYLTYWKTVLVNKGVWNAETL